MAKRKQLDAPTQTELDEQLEGFLGVFVFEEEVGPDAEE